MKRQSGFTLIELIIVIVILGILAVTAAPQFFNFGGDARTSTVRGMEGSVKAAADLVYARSAVAGVEGQSSSSVNFASQDTGAAGEGQVDVVWGYPAATEDGIIAAVNADIVPEDDLDGNDWYFVEVTEGIQIFPRGQENTSNCYVQYTAATGSGGSMTARAEVSAVVSGC